MKHRLPFSQKPIITAGLLAATTLLAACEEGQFASTGTQAGATANVELIEQEVEKPDVFQATDRGLWDGRPSLGGLWVAHIGADQPERAIIINTATGAEVKAALFRREPGNPGPAFQLSSGVAASLGILAGVPTEIRVTAIRRETIEVVTSAPVSEAEPVAGDSGPDGSSLEPITASEILAVPAAAAATAAPKPKSKPGVPAKPSATSASAPETEIEETPIAATPAPQEKPATEASAGFDDGTAVPSKPYIQVATLSTTEGADALVKRLEKAGFRATRKPSGSGDGLKYIVIVGPIATEARAKSDLKKVRGMGFNDAFPSRGL